MIATITLSEAHELMNAQGVSHARHFAFRCPICKTVQSMASLVLAGATPELAEKYIAFSCEGRVSGVGPMPPAKDKTAKAKARRQKRGCDWTLGGFFQLQDLNISYPDGKVRPSFEIVGSEEAQFLETEMKPRIDAVRAEAS